MAVVIDHQHRNNHDLYTVEVGGSDVTVTVTASAAAVRKWLTYMLYFHRRHVYLNQLVVGLGVQWTPGGADPPADTLQLCVGQRCLIFQLAQADTVPWSLRTFLKQSHTFVGFWNHSDRKKLKNSEHELLLLRDPLDLRLHVETEDDENLARASVEEIVEKCLGFEVELRREISKSDWDRKYLSDDQVAYATSDAYCAFLIGRNTSVWEH